MSQCNKQFDPLKPCRKRRGEKVDYLKIDLSNERFIGAYEAAQINNPRYLGNHYPCGHYWFDHLNTPDDLINVEEEGNFEKHKMQMDKIRAAFFHVEYGLNELRRVLEQ